MVSRISYFVFRNSLFLLYLLPTTYCLLFIATGCGARKSSLLLERNARGPLSEALSVAKRFEWQLEPVRQTQTQQDIEVAVNHASREFLDNLFKNTDLFGEYAGRNPYYLENLVFYLQISNKGKGRIFVDPGAFTVVDDRGNQYAMIGMDYVTALADARAPFATATRGAIEDVRPGYFGLSLPVGKMVSAKPQGQFALLKQSALQGGYYYPGVVHDGIVAFWNPSTNATTVRLLITNVKADFSADNFPKTSLEFVFDFTATKPQD
ncbi:MAG: hypothetical protein HY595_02765 [Candidatus Omnitrophica bacterium]|nr:hypothetical protein [Candidatus Omnitrophota bacterium]